MLHLTIVAVGKIKEDYLRQGIAEYQKRLTAYAKLKIIEVPDSPWGVTLLGPKRKKEKDLRRPETPFLCGRLRPAGTKTNVGRVCPVVGRPGEWRPGSIHGGRRRVGDRAGGDGPGR